MTAYSDVPVDELAVSEALKSNRGDLILAHQSLGISFARLHMFVRRIPALRRLVTEIEVLKRDDRYDELSADQFRDEINARLLAYELDGLDTIHKLAVTDHDGNASMAEVRLKAAIQLRTSERGTPNSLAGMMAELNQQYLQTAGRVKGLRATVQLSIEEAEGATPGIPAAASLQAFDDSAGEALPVPRLGSVGSRQWPVEGS